jgi:hypothetical protein
LLTAWLAAFCFIVARNGGFWLRRILRRFQAGQLRIGRTAEG